MYRRLRQGAKGGLKTSIFQKVLQITANGIGCRGVEGAYNPGKYVLPGCITGILLKPFCRGPKCFALLTASTAASSGGAGIACRRKFVQCSPALDRLIVVEEPPKLSTGV